LFLSVARMLNVFRTSLDNILSVKAEEVAEDAPEQQ
jgi:hypothetical protein